MILKTFKKYNKNLYLLIQHVFIVLVLAVLVICTARILTFLSLCVRSSRKLHLNMFNSVMSTSVRFFDLNPIGRIMNRFSKDVGQLDGELIENFF